MAQRVVGGGERFVGRVVATFNGVGAGDAVVITVPPGADAARIQPQLWATATASVLIDRGTARALPNVSIGGAGHTTLTFAESIAALLSPGDYLLVDAAGTPQKVVVASITDDTHVEITAAATDCSNKSCARIGVMPSLLANEFALDSRDTLMDAFPAGTVISLLLVDADGTAIAGAAGDNAALAFYTNVAGRATKVGV